MKYPLDNPPDVSYQYKLIAGVSATILGGGFTVFPFIVMIWMKAGEPGIISCSSSILAEIGCWFLQVNAL